MLADKSAFRQKCLQTKVPADKSSCRRKYLQANVVAGKSTCRQKYLRAKKLAGKISCRQTYLQVKALTGKGTCRQKYLQAKVLFELKVQVCAFASGRWYLCLPVTILVLYMALWLGWRCCYTLVKASALWYLEFGLASHGIYHSVSHLFWVPALHIIFPPCLLPSLVGEEAGQGACHGASSTPR